MISIKGPWFIDKDGRVVFLRGVNLGGSTKIPTKPDGSTYRTEGFFEHRNVSFVNRPFPLEQADEHYRRLRSWGFNCLRFLITWEAVEHSGPGIYDEEYLDYLYKVVKKAGEHGFYVFIDPHQDVWSRFSGGDGAPGWTLEKVGFEITKFKETGAALVHQTHGDPFPRMLWPTNAYKLAAATMFTLFFAGNDFAPKTKIEGIPAQDFLQQHFLGTIKKVAEKLQDLECVIGFDSLNEPQRGYVEVKDLAKLYGEMDFGYCPTPWQSMTLGSGFSHTITHRERTLLGVRKGKKKIINPNGERAWLPEHQCVWEQNGVWELDERGIPALKNPDYFASVNGKEVNFVQDYLTPFLKKMINTVHEVNEKWIVFIESEVQQLPPNWNDIDQGNIAFAPHWYDGVLLFMKRYFSFIGYDILQKRVVLGQQKVIDSFRAQLGQMKSLSRERLGNIPVLIGEIGIPYDMHEKHAFATGDFSAQIRSMHRCMQALEDNLLSFTLWNYTSDNTNARGDRWNDEDLSLYSEDQRKNHEDINSGGRALESVIRPAPIAITGIPTKWQFNLKNKEFVFEFEGDPQSKNPSTFYLPRYQYPNGADIEVSDGSVEVNEAEQLVSFSTLTTQAHWIRFTAKQD
jgi:hypothetical protein